MTSVAAEFKSSPWGLKDGKSRAGTVVPQEDGVCGFNSMIQFNSTNI